VTQALADLADRNACFGKRADAGVRLHPPQISLVLDALGRGEQYWVMVAVPTPS